MIYSSKKISVRSAYFKNRTCSLQHKETEQLKEHLPQKRVKLQTTEYLIYM